MREERAPQTHTCAARRDSSELCAPVCQPGAPAGDPGPQTEGGVGWGLGWSSVASESAPPAQKGKFLCADYENPPLSLKTRLVWHQSGVSGETEPGGATEKDEMDFKDRVMGCGQWAGRTPRLGVGGGPQPGGRVPPLGNLPALLRPSAAWTRPTHLHSDCASLKANRSFHIYHNPGVSSQRPRAGVRPHNQASQPHQANT